jgi:hypothetical protein
MALDALDPGPSGDYPWIPRNPDGTLDTVRMPVGLRRQRVNRELVLIDVTPTLPDGRPITALVPLPADYSGPYPTGWPNA